MLRTFLFFPFFFSNTMANLCTASTTLFAWCRKMLLIIKDIMLHILLFKSRSPAQTQENGSSNTYTHTLRLNEINTINFMAYLHNFVFVHVTEMVVLCESSFLSVLALLIVSAIMQRYWMG